MTIGVRLPAKDEEEEDYKAKAMNEVDAGRDRATPASLRHDDEEEDVLSSFQRAPFVFVLFLSI